MSACEPMENSLWMTSRMVRSVSMTKVVRLLGGSSHAALGAELGGDRAVGVREQRQAERLLLVELLLLLDRVGADADGLCADGGELGGEVTEVAALLRAAVRHGGRVEEQHDRARWTRKPLSLRVRARLVGELEIGDDVAFVHPLNVGRTGRRAGHAGLRPRSGSPRPAP